MKPTIVLVHGAFAESVSWSAVIDSLTSAGHRVITHGEHIPGMYVTGWIKRGPVGLIGHTKGDAGETIAGLLEDADTLPAAPDRKPENVA